MIFITVGNGEFDELVKEVDSLKLKDVVVQLGHGTYKPENCKWFKFKSPLDSYYDKADLVISHGGPGTVFEVLRRGKRLIAVPNRKRTDPRHQVEYLRAMAKETSALIYCDRVRQIADCIQKANKHKFSKYRPGKCRMGEAVDNFLK